MAATDGQIKTRQTLNTFFVFSTDINFVVSTAATAAATATLACLHAEKREKEEKEGEEGGRGRGGGGEEGGGGGGGLVTLKMRSPKVGLTDGLRRRLLWLPRLSYPLPNWRRRRWPRTQTNLTDDSFKARERERDDDQRHERRVGQISVPVFLFISHTTQMVATVRCFF